MIDGVQPNGGGTTQRGGCMSRVRVVFCVIVVTFLITLLMDTIYT